MLTSYSVYRGSFRARVVKTQEASWILLRLFLLSSVDSLLCHVVFMPGF